MPLLEHCVMYKGSHVLLLMTILIHLSQLSILWEDVHVVCSGIVSQMPINALTCSIEVELFTKEELLSTQGWCRQFCLVHCINYIVI